MLLWEQGIIIGKILKIDVAWFSLLYIKDASKKFEECLFIGESTIHSARPVKSLKDAKDMYDLSWGCNSFCTILD